MPRLSDTMEEGTILRWLKQAGDQVTAGEVLAEVETDKADMELEAAASGTLASIEVAVGESAAVGAVLARLDGDSAGIDPVDAPSASASPTAPEAPSSSPARQPGPIKSSPAARQIAEEHGIPLADIRGSGPGGRIVKEDVLTLLASSTSAEPVAAARAPGPPPRAPASPPRAPARPSIATSDAPTERHELSRMRRSIARRMTESFRDIPHFSVTTEIDMTEAVRLKAALAASEVYATPPTYTHMILRACALALRRHPRVNSSFEDDALVIHADVNLGMAVAVDDGLIVPVLRRADERSLAELAVEARRLGEQATQGRFAREDLTGGTFTVSNLGMFAIDDFTAVINPPQAAILAVGAIKERAVVREGQLAVARTMRVTLSCDHRIVDGAMASRFLEELTGLLEQPIVLVVDGR